MRERKKKKEIGEKMWYKTTSPEYNGLGDRSSSNYSTLMKSNEENR